MHHHNRPCSCLLCLGADLLSGTEKLPAGWGHRASAAIIYQTLKGRFV